MSTNQSLNYCCHVRYNPVHGVRSDDGVSAFWQQDNEEVETGSDIQIDNDGKYVFYRFMPFTLHEN